MVYVKGIVYRDNLIFPDTGSVDIHINGRPTLNISSILNGQIYFLRMSSNIASYSKHASKMEIIKPEKSNGLSKPSIVKVDHILKEVFRSHYPKGYLSEDDYTRVIAKFHGYQKVNCCESNHCSCCDYEIIVKHS